MKVFIAFAFIFSFLFGETRDNNKSNTNDTIQTKQIIFLSYENVPQKVFVDQVFSIKVKAIITVNDFNEIKKGELETKLLQEKKYLNEQLEYIENKFQYIFSQNTGYINQAFYIVKYNHELKMEVVE
ncbi:MAG: hypothetical protein L3J44_01805 [Campylobacteraceae bacterium]|nr:hypothetical protein [Campylobacteraceae bacterium]